MESTHCQLYVLIPNSFPKSLCPFSLPSAKDESSYFSTLSLSWHHHINKFVNIKCYICFNVHFLITKEVGHLYISLLDIYLSSSVNLLLYLVTIFLFLYYWFLKTFNMFWTLIIGNMSCNYLFSFYKLVFSFLSSFILQKFFVLM